MTYRSVAIWVGILLVVVSANTRAQDAVTLDSIIGSPMPGEVKANTDLVFFFKFQINGGNMKNMQNCFIVGSPDGAGWQLPAIDTLDYMLSSYLDGGQFFTITPSGGSGADTAYWAGFSIFGSGVPSGYYDFALKLSSKVDESDVGKTICIDSADGTPACYWSWTSNATGTFKPDWAGPYCFEIVSCCQGFRGNVDGDPGDMIDITDLTYLVAYAFQGGPHAPCVFEGDVNADGGLTPFILDLTYLVDYMFNGGPEPPACP